ncbi:Ger(x)C family spore germination protein [Bacillus sp. MRMR6]|uniref:Ger(x)C family spore germination protein n=1 Tax=Bacillus sp. MRMR6 TaxID=1928617 RepID=UPI0009FB6A6C|nr:Ger(x)C family spore germination protein [Bacillus sp. MRMR6]
MKPIKAVLKYSPFLIVLLLLSGCWDKKELEERAYVIGLGLDKNADSNHLTITFLIANPEVGSQQGGGGTQEPAQEILTIRANDFISARNTANTVIARELTYDLLRVFVISEELASDKDFIRYIYDATKDREIRRDSYLIVSKEDASVFFTNNKPKLESRPHKYFQFMIDRGIATGVIPDSDLHRFFRVTENDAELFLAIYATTETEKNKSVNSEDEYLAGEIDAKGTANQTQFIGSAVFKEGRMIGKITGQETRISELLDDTTRIKDILTTYPDPFSDRFRLAARLIKNEDTEVSVDIRNGPPKISVNIPLVIEILSDPSMTSYGDDEEKKKILKKHLEEHLTDTIQTFVEKMKEEFKGEAFMWSIYARKKFKTVQEYTEYDWMKTYPEAEVKVAVEVTFGEFGKQSKVPSLEILRD